jgi:hypothetical protein
MRYVKHPPFAAHIDPSTRSSSLSLQLQCFTIDDNPALRYSLTLSPKGSSQNGPITKLQLSATGKYLVAENELFYINPEREAQRVSFKADPGEFFSAWFSHDESICVLVRREGRPESKESAIESKEMGRCALTLYELRNHKAVKLSEIPLGEEKLDPSVVRIAFDHRRANVFAYSLSADSDARYTHVAEYAQGKIQTVKVLEGRRPTRCCSLWR